MKFLDLNTGYSFDGLWTENQSRGYIFWFPNEQSTNITYSMPICIITDSADSLHLSIEENSLFKFISHKSEQVELDCCVFNEPDYQFEISTEPIEINNKYIHVVNVSATSRDAGEYICKIKIDNVGFIKVGADFYGEYEPYDINLSNFGVELPDTIQKAIYDSNIHEDYKDNILLNRKYKELLSNYWDIIANRGSYKSLNNSLDWFEWGDLLKIKEIWKRDEAGRIMFDDREVMSIFESKLEDSYNNFIKTTYIALYCLLYQDSDDYDIEGNPILIENTIKWAKNDIQLKLSLLTQFFGVYFLPIHLSILYSTVEDQIYTNTVKSVFGTSMSRQDSIGDFNYISSNIKDNEIFKLNNIKTYTSKNSIFNDLYVSNENDYGTKEWVLSDDKISINEFPDNNVNDLKDFFTTFYSGPGAIIPIHFNIKNQIRKDFIKQTIIRVNEKKYVCFDKIDVKNYEFDIKFNFIAKDAGEYTLNFTFITATGKTLTKQLHFTVEDVDNLCLNVYKVQAKDDSKGFTYSDFSNTYNYRYFFRNQPSKIEYDENGNPIIDINDTNCYYMQYLPYMNPDNPKFDSYKGIKLNRTIVIKVEDYDNLTKYDLTNLRFWFKDYLEFQRRVEDNIIYLIFVSKYFYADTPEHVFEHPEYNIIRNDLVFYPQFHNLVRMTGLNESNYTVSLYEAVCCAPEINVSKNNIKPFKYSHKLTGAEWTFINSSTKKNINHPSSSRQPFIVREDGLIQPGYYDISFKYSLSNGIEGECRLDSAFRIKII